MKNLEGSAVIVPMTLHLIAWWRKPPMAKHGPVIVYSREKGYTQTELETLVSKDTQQWLRAENKKAESENQTGKETGK